MICVLLKILLILVLLAGFLLHLKFAIDHWCGALTAFYIIFIGTMITIVVIASWVALDFIFLTF